MVHESTRSAVKNFLRAINGDSRGVLEALHDEVIHEHRYIQGEAISILCRAIYAIGKENHGKDARNEHAINLCEAVVRFSDSGVVDAEDLNKLRNFFF